MWLLKFVFSNEKKKEYFKEPQKPHFGIISITIGVCFNSPKMWLLETV